MTDKMKKQLGLLDVFASCTGAMISSGWFVLPGVAAAKAEPVVIVAYLASGLMLIPSMLSMAEMSTALPRVENPRFIDDWIATHSVDDLAGLLLSTDEE